ncbi:MAG: RNA-binding protein [Xanthobacteraceae bacterium]
MLARIDDVMTDSGPRAGAARERFCVVTRAALPLDELIRFVAAPDGRVIPDIKRKLPGRGAWVTARRDAVALAVRRGALKRALGGTAEVSADLPDLTGQLLRRAVLDALAMASKAGQVAAGFTKTLAALESGAAVGIVHASEAAADGIRKITAAAERSRIGAARQPLCDITILTSMELDLALARSNVVHAALLSGYASEAVLARFHVLDRYCTNAAGKKGGDTAVTIEPGPGS